MLRIRCILVFLATALSGQTVGQETLPVNGIQDQRAARYALTNASVMIAPDEVIEGGTLLISDGSIVSVGPLAEVPEGYVTVDLTGRHIYPTFIELNSNYGLPEVSRPPATSFFSQPEVLAPQKSGAYASNDAIRSDYRASEQFTVNDELANKLRKQGFGLVLTARRDGIARGTSALVTLSDANVREVMLNPEAARHYSLIKGASRQAFPISKMGAVALLRQTLIDANWYSAQSERPFTDLSLEALINTTGLPTIAQSQDWRDVLRLAEIGAEFDESLILQTSGDSYQRLDAVKATGLSLIVPVNFPKARKLDTEFQAQNIALRDLMHWEHAPSNPAAIEAAGIQFALSSHGSQSEFLANLRLALKHGLSRRTALAALTTVPAQMLGISNVTGRLTRGARADFFVTQGDLFEEDAGILESWIGGKRHLIKAFAPDRSGNYELMTNSDTPLKLIVAGKPGKPSLKLPSADDTSVKPSISFEDAAVTLSIPDFNNASTSIKLNGWRSEPQSGADWVGIGTDAAGVRFNWSMRRTGDAEFEQTALADPEKATADVPPAPVPIPFEAYGQASRIPARNVIIRNATVWTNETEGILKNADIVIRDGKIAAVGQGLNGEGLAEVDGSEKHVTPGIIDEHSHIALSAVNDIATNSAMVRMRDVVDSEDVDIYRNLAGGVTAAQLLHGSANPIGGQSAIIKMRWGALPSEMLIKDAPGFIKFALGENVKRTSNAASIRYPQTRMGVEQVFLDAFTRARAYGDSVRRYNQLSGRQQSRTSAPRRDLALEPLLEILESDRFISAHSYVQSEINMLMKVADQFDFTVNTFTHILEGYKVADKMATHGAGGSTFSDWWAYKWEVRYAIPYNANLMTQAGVVTAINSDSAEMSRRLNQEAAKSVKYGGMAEQEALKLITLNPAKLLHLDHRTGSLKAGKDADVVLWSDHPLSIYARAEMTFVDGAPLFDLNRDRELNQSISTERARLIQLMRHSKRQEKVAGAGGGSGPGTLQCDSLEQDYMNTSAWTGARS